MEIELMCVKASLASLEWTASVRERGTVLAVENVLPPLSLMTQEVTNALRMVSIIHFMIKKIIRCIYIFF